MKAKQTDKFHGKKWKRISLDELMILYAILMQMACRPFKGKSYEECWDHTKDWFPNYKHMTLRQYKISDQPYTGLTMKHLVRMNTPCIM